MRGKLVWIFAFVAVAGLAATATQRTSAQTSGVTQGSNCQQWQAQTWQTQQYIQGFPPPTVSPPAQPTVTPSPISYLPPNPSNPACGGAGGYGAGTGSSVYTPPQR